MDPNKAKLMFYVLLEAASRYREAYWREELDQFEKDAKNLMHTTHDYQGANRTVRRIIERKVTDIVSAHRAKLDRFNTTMYAELDGILKSYKEQSYVKLDNFVTAYALLVEELDRAENTTHVLAVLRLYNEGHLDHLRGIIERKSEELNNQYENHETTDSNIHRPGATDGQLQERQPQADGRTSEPRSHDIRFHHGN